MPPKEVPEERTYTVTGTRSYQGHEPGETFTATLSPEAEQRAIDRGAISLGQGEKSKGEAQAESETGKE
jgi:hypothetical protein